MIDVIAFDADDTLWHNETLFQMTQERFGALIAPYLQAPWTGKELYETELRNLRHFGYGIKGFTLSMIETAIELTGGRIPAREIQTIIDFGRAMIGSPIELIDGVAEVVPALSRRHTLMLITKGDLFEQETKIAKSGVAQHFAHVEVVSDKTVASYRGLLAARGVDPQRFLMVGNSLRSDILPVLELGGHAAYVPYHVTWAHEVIAEEAIGGHVFHRLESIRELPALVERLNVAR
ncbi:MAG TPA: HAD family hydrolase [Roseiflexaceae bacterium]|nr:HAD family hydrolase [Roseiflexaceae bacterium]